MRMVVIITVAGRRIHVAGVRIVIDDELLAHIARSCVRLAEPIYELGFADPNPFRKPGAMRLRPVAGTAAHKQR